jgi:hypothetical protein
MPETNDTGTLQYWEPGSEERRLRIFVSHRYGSDAALYDDVIRSLNSQGFSVQDMSLSAQQMLSGPRGGQLPDMTVQAEIAARIYTSDVLIAPSRVGAGRSEWVTWEVQLAAVGYSIPILFVNQKVQQRSTRLVSEIEALGAEHRVCDPTTPQIVSSVVQLVGRPNWAMRQDEPAGTIRYRGPPSAARTEVLKKFPFEPRLAAVEVFSPRAKRGIWDIITGRRE